jgi:hypothetical protein
MPSIVTFFLVNFMCILSVSSTTDCIAREIWHHQQFPSQYHHYRPFQENIYIPYNNAVAIPGLAVNFARLGQWTPHEVFRYLHDDLDAVASFATHHRTYVYKTETVLFRSYRAPGSGHLFCILTFLMDVPDFPSHVETITLDDILDGPRRSGFWDWLWLFGVATLPPAAGVFRLTTTAGRPMDGQSS